MAPAHGEAARVSDSPRDLIRRVMGALAPGASGKAMQTAERDLIKAVVLVLARDGYTLNMAALALEVPVTTLRSWRDKDAVFAGDLEGSDGLHRKWLLGELRARLELDGKREGLSGVGQSINVLSNLAFPELRESKVQVSPPPPTPDESREAVLGILNKSKPNELPGTTPAPADAI